ncbi:MAG: sulfurtransferase, partial [Gammaproteobacteria bacterium]|nr:sulfurtransferase [Gammaproteobacteria bacterium]
MQHNTLIDAATLAPLLSDPRIAVIDCRFDLAHPEAGRAAYLAAHIPGARYASLDADLSAAVAPGTGRHPLPTPADFARTLGALGVDNDTQVVAYDAANGAFAARLWWMLRWLGHRRAAVLDGGFAAWVASGGAVAAGAVPAAGRRFAARADEAAWLTT